MTQPRRTQRGNRLVSRVHTRSKVLWAGASVGPAAPRSAEADEQTCWGIGFRDRRERVSPTVGAGNRSASTYVTGLRRIPKDSCTLCPFTSALVRLVTPMKGIAPKLGWRLRANQAPMRVAEDTSEESNVVIVGNDPRLRFWGVFAVRQVVSCWDEVEPVIKIAHPAGAPMQSEH